MVGQMFREIGCEVTVGYVAPNVRGRKEIDVYVKDPIITPPATYLCECKLWARPVPQEVVHSFRTVMADTGANRGYIISHSGFQSGAREAAEHTNVELVTFDELQAIFFDRWRVAMGKHFRPASDELFPYWDYPGRMPRFKWEPAHVKRNSQLHEAYRPLLHLNVVFEMHGSRFNLPLVVPAVDELGNIQGEVRLETYRQVYDFIEVNLPLAKYHYQVLYGEIEPNRTPGEYHPRA